MNANIHKKIITVVVFLFTLFTACKDKDNPVKIKDVNDEIGVVIVDKSVLRIDPLIYSAVISYMSKGETALVLGESGEKMRLGKNDEYWYYVRFSGGDTGWMYGGNLKIFPAGKKNAIQRYISDIWSVEYEKFRRRIVGTWESVEKEGSLRQSLDLFEDSKYQSSRAESKTIEGEYGINFNKREIIFKSGTYFGDKIIFYQLSNGSFLKRSIDDPGIKFIKVSSKNTKSDEK